MKTLKKILKTILLILFFNNNIFFTKGLTNKVKKTQAKKTVQTRKTTPQTKKTVTTRKTTPQTAKDEENKQKLNNIKSEWKKEQINTDDEIEKWAKKHRANYIEYLFLKFILDKNTTIENTISLKLNNTTIKQYIDNNIKNINSEIGKDTPKTKNADNIKTILTIAKKELLNFEDKDFLAIKNSIENIGRLQKLKNKFFGNDKIDELIFLLHKKYSNLIKKKNEKYTDLKTCFDGFIVFINNEEKTIINDNFIKLEELNKSPQNDILKFASIRKDIYENYTKPEKQFLIANRNLLAAVLKINEINPFIKQKSENFWLESLKNNKIFHYLDKHKWKITAGTTAGIVLSLAGRKYNEKSPLLKFANKLNPVNWLIGAKNKNKDSSTSNGNKTGSNNNKDDLYYDKNGNPTEKAKKEFEKNYNSKANVALRAHQDKLKESWAKSSNAKKAWTEVLKKEATQFLSENNIEDNEENKKKYAKVEQTFNYLKSLNQNLPSEFTLSWLYNHYDIYNETKNKLSEGFFNKKKLEDHIDLFFNAIKMQNLNNPDSIEKYINEYIKVENIEKQINEIKKKMIDTYKIIKKNPQDPNINDYKKEFIENKNRIQELKNNLSKQNQNIVKTLNNLKEESINSKKGIEEFDDIMKNMNF